MLSHMNMSTRTSGPKNTIILVSGCLIGMKCNYKGKANLREWVLNLKDNYTLVPVCPEQLGGLPTPRLPVEIQEGDGYEIWEGSSNQILTSNGGSVVHQLISGAKETIKIARILGIKVAVLKDKSPSCGVFSIYDGSFSGELKRGVGVATAALRSNNVEVFSSENPEDPFFI